MAKFCPNCGIQNEDTAAFCSNCGTGFAYQSGGQAPRTYQQNTPTQQPYQTYPPAPQPQYPQPEAQPQQPQYAQPQYQQQGAQQPLAQQPYPPYPQPPQQYVQQPQYPLPAAQTAQPAQPINRQAAAFADMHTVLMQAPGALNIPGRPWAVTIEGTSIVARWKWMDATFFAPHEVTDDTRQYTFTVTLSENGKWKELDVTENKSSGVKMSGGKLSFGSSSNSFKGKTNQKSFNLGMGQNNQTGQAGLIGFKFDTTMVKQPIRDYLTSQGWKKN